MSKTLSDIKSVMLIDDEPGARESLSYLVEDVALTAVEPDGRLGELDEFLQLPNTADAAISDYMLTPHGYAAFNGAALVSAWYQRNFPAVLSTRYDNAELLRIRPYRRWIPVLMAPNELNEDTLMRGFETSLLEIGGEFKPVRRPWRAQVHFAQNDEEYAGQFFVELPGWQRDEFIQIRLVDLPETLRGSVAEGFRCFAQANLGSEDANDLYLCDWEVPSL